MPVSFNFSDAPYERADNFTGQITYSFDLDGMTFTIGSGPFGGFVVGSDGESQGGLKIFGGAHRSSYHLLRWHTEDGATQLTGDIELETNNSTFRFVLSTGERVDHVDGHYSGGNVVGVGFFGGGNVVSLKADGLAPPRDMPDLAVTAFHVDRTEVFSGTRPEIEVSYTIENSGSQDIGPSTALLYSSPFKYPSELSTPLEELDIPALKAGESVSGIAKTKVNDSKPSKTYLFLRADSERQYAERTGDNNLAGSITVTVVDGPPPGPDLAVQGLRVTRPTLTYDDPLNVDFNVVNRGDTAAADSAAMLYISRNTGTAWNDAVPLVALPSVGALAPGGRSAQGTPTGFTLDLAQVGLAPGNYQIVAVADSGGAVAEFSETNNIASIPVVVDAPVIDPPVATQGPDQLTGTPYRTSLKLLGGDDAYAALGGNDFADGGPGDDTIDGGVGDDRIFGGSGFDRLSGGPGDDSLSGGANADLLLGGAGNDSLNAGDGLDRALGGSGEDVILGGADDDRLWGAGGFDTIRGGAGDDDIDGGDQADHLYGGLGDDTILGGGGVDWLSGGVGEDSLQGGAQADQLFGGTGNDKLYGGLGLDRLEGGADNDLLYGGAGPDGLIGGAGHDTLFGEYGADRFYGGLGDDALDGGAQADTLHGGDGADTLTGGPGDDLLFGETGGDLFVFADGHGADTIADFYTLNAFEKIDLSAVSALGSATDVADGVLIATGVGTSILLEGVTLADLQPEDFVF